MADLKKERRKEIKARHKNIVTRITEVPLQSWLRWQGCCKKKIKKEEVSFIQKWLAHPSKRPRIARYIDTKGMHKYIHNGGVVGGVRVGIQSGGLRLDVHRGSIGHDGGDVGNGDTKKVSVGTQESDEI
jgi:hypothetical protein